MNNRITRAPAKAPSKLPPHFGGQFGRISPNRAVRGLKWEEILGAWLADGKTPNISLVRLLQEL
ncbi:MAG: hypothetical protein LBB34_02545 [Holosporales bacterium]|nr:hypothetical protein [Holosporales bacterium]